MFCIKCGSKSIEGAEFCLKCGAKLILDKSSLQTLAAPTSVPKPVESVSVPKPAESAPAPMSVSSNVKMTAESVPHAPNKRKSKKLLFGIAGCGAILAVIAIIILVISEGGRGSSDLFQIAQGVSPMTEFGFDATYGDVFRWLMTDMQTNLEQQGDVAVLTFSGKVTGGNFPVSVVLRMTGLSSNTSGMRLEPHTMTVNGVDVPDFNNNPQGVLMDLFWAQHRWANYQERELETFMAYTEVDPYIWSSFGIVEGMESFGLASNQVGGQANNIDVHNWIATESDMSANVNLSFEEMIANNTPVATVNGTPLGAGVVATMVAGAKQTLGEGADARTILEEAVRQGAIMAVVEGYAMQNSISLTHEEIDEFTAGIDSIRALYGEEAFYEMIQSYGYLSMEHLMTVDIMYVLTDKVITTIIESPALFAPFERYMEEYIEINEEILAAKHILIAFEIYDTTEEALALAQQLWRRAIAGEDFDALIAEYGNDPGMELNPQGYTFTSGAMVSEFEEGTRNLRIGEISNPIASSYGFHIILRVAPDMNNIIRMPLDSGPPSLEQYKSNAIVVRFDEIASNAEIIFFPWLYNIPVE